MGKVHDFIKSSYYIIIVFLFTLLCWNNYNLTASTIGLSIIACFILFTNGPIEGLLPLMFAALFSSRSYMSLKTFPWILFVCGFVVIIALIFYVIKNRKKMQKPKMLIGLSIITFASILSLINLKPNGQNVRYLYSLAPILYLGTYVFFACFMEKGKENFLCKVLLFLGVFLSFELLLEGFKLGSFDKKIITLGWGGANTVSIFVNIAIVAVAFLICKCETIKEIVFYIIWIGFLTIIQFVTKCRTGLLALAIMCIPIIVMTILCAKKRELMVRVLVIGCCVGIILLPFLFDEIIDVVRKIFVQGFDDNFRFEIWTSSISEYVNHPIIGNGLFSNVVTIQYTDVNRLTACHNTFVQCLFSFGLLGLFGLLYHLFEKYRILYRGMSSFKIFYVLICAITFVHGMLDNTYFMIYYMMVLMPILVVAEKNEKQCLFYKNNFVYNKKKIIYNYHVETRDIMNEQQDNGMSLIDLFRIMFCKKRMMLIIIFAVLVVGVLFIKLGYNKKTMKYTLSYEYSIVDLDDGKYCDGSTFNYSELVSLENLKSVKALDEKFASINVEKMFKTDDIIIVRDKGIDEKTNVEYCFYYLSAKAKYFSTGDLATEFLTGVANIPCRKTLEIAKQNSYSYFTDLFQQANTYEAQIQLVVDMKSTIIDKYKEFIKNYGDLVLGNSKSLNQYIEDIELFFINNNINLLNVDIEKNGYVKKGNQSMANLELQKQSLTYEKEQNTLKVEALKTERDKVAASTVETVEEYDKKIIEYLIRNIDIERDLKNINLKLSVFDSIDNSSFESKLNTYKTIIETYIDDFDAAELDVYTKQAKIYVVSNKAIISGGFGIVVSGILSIAVGLVISCIVNIIVYYSLEEKKEKKQQEQIN